MKEEFTVTSREKGWRLDKFILEKVPDWISRTLIQKAIKDGKILVNSQKKKPSYKVKPGEIVTVEVPDKPEKVEVKPEKIDLNIIYEDRDIIVINKPSGMIVHPVGNKVSSTLVNALLYHCKDLQGIGGELRPGIVHRLDKDTSGIMVIAKNDKAHINLSTQFKERKTKKIYLAIVKGIFKEKEGVIDFPITRHPHIRTKMMVATWGKSAITLYKVLKSFSNIASLLWIELKTGRTHQIRVHMKKINHPLFGDELYGKIEEIDKILGANRQMLHALYLGFYHPRTGKWMSFYAKVPEDFKNVLIRLKDFSE